MGLLIAAFVLAVVSVVSLIGGFMGGSELYLLAGAVILHLLADLV